MQPDEMRAIRKAASMTQQAFADAMGMSRKAINEMELGKAQIERRTALAVECIRMSNMHVKIVTQEGSWLCDGTFSAIPRKGETIILNGYHYSVHDVMHATNDQMEFSATLSVGLRKN